MKKKILTIIALVLFFTLSFGQVVLAADKTIDSSMAAMITNVHELGGIYWVSEDTGYIIYMNISYAIAYAKTEDGGSTWNIDNELVAAGGATCIASWADWMTPNDTGTVIHIVYLSLIGDTLKYTNLDAYDDSQGGIVTIESLNDVATPSSLVNHGISITKTYGSQLAVAYRAYDAPGGASYGFETSSDGGTTWITESSPWEGSGDHIEIYPANTGNQNDVWATFWDISADEISLKTYTDSSDSWSETSIETLMYDDTDWYLLMSGQIRHSDRDIIFSSWDKYSATNTTLKVWDIADNTSITELTPIIENADGYFQSSTFIDQTNNEIYISYFKGTLESMVALYYQKSIDGGVTWSGEVSYSETTDDLRYVCNGAMRSDLGGNFMPFWINDDLDDLITNTVYSIELSANTFSNPAIAPEYVIDCPTCTDNLTSSGNFTSNETFSGGPPGFSVIDDAASESGAPPIWLWGWIGMFAIITPGFFITYMERKFGSGNGTLILRMGVALIVIGMLVTWGRFDWWMVVFYIVIAAAPALMSRQYDFGGAGGISQQGWIGFCATSWLGLTLINRILEGQFLTSSESSWWCSIQLFNEFRVFDLFTLPVLNFQFFTVGIPSLLRWDYSFFGGNAELIQYLLYTVTAVVAFILFVIMVGLLFNAFRAR